MDKRRLLKMVLAVTLTCASLSFAAEGVAVKGNKKSKIYHKAVCRHYNAKGTTEEFRTEDAATQAGYKACRKCNKLKANKQSEKKTKD
ncbi:MAG TPA: Ada metal-binding domain-containing protein [Pontiella sp.]